MREFSPTIVFVLSVLTLAQVAALQGQESDEEVQVLQNRIEDFFQNLNDEESEPQKAFTDLLAGGPLAGGELKKLIDGVADLEKKYGEYLESERIAAKRVGRDLVLLRYLYKTRTYPIAWYFTYSDTCVTAE